MCFVLFLFFFSFSGERESIIPNSLTHTTKVTTKQQHKKRQQATKPNKQNKKQNTFQHYIICIHHTIIIMAANNGNGRQGSNQMNEHVEFSVGITHNVKCVIVCVWGGCNFFVVGETIYTRDKNGESWCLSSSYGGDPIVDFAIA